MQLKWYGFLVILVLILISGSSGFFISKEIYKKPLPFIKSNVDTVMIHHVKIDTIITEPIIKIIHDTVYKVGGLEIVTQSWADTAYKTKLDFNTKYFDFYVTMLTQFELESKFLIEPEAIYNFNTEFFNLQKQQYNIGFQYGYDKGINEKRGISLYQQIRNGIIAIGIYEGGKQIYKVFK